MDETIVKMGKTGFTSCFKNGFLVSTESFGNISIFLNRLRNVSPKRCVDFCQSSCIINRRIFFTAEAVGLRLQQ